MAIVNKLYRETNHHRFKHLRLLVNGIQCADEKVPAQTLCHRSPHH